MVSVWMSRPEKLVSLLVIILELTQGERDIRLPLQGKQYMEYEWNGNVSRTWAIMQNTNVFMVGWDEWWGLKNTCNSRLGISHFVLEKSGLLKNILYLSSTALNSLCSFAKCITSSQSLGLGQGHSCHPKGPTAPHVAPIPHSPRKLQLKLSFKRPSAC